MTEGKRMYEFCEKIYPICRSITGNGVRETYKYLQEEIAPAKFTMYEVPTGTHVLDWTVPKEWNIRDAYIIDPDGNRLCEFKKHNLNLLHYSVPVDMDVSLEELKEHLYTLKDQPDVVPYASSYYKERWGFCMTRRQFDTLKEGTYHVYIDSTLEEGSLTYGELIFEGESQEEVLFSSYTCHPSMANNECSGPAVI
nr:DUF2172 domain-containing protein [Lachnospiraceae bacterium]